MITFGLSGDSRVIFRNHHKSKFLLSFSSLGDVKRIDPEALLEVFFNIKFRFYVFARHSWFQVSLKNKLFKVTSMELLGEVREKYSKAIQLNIKLNELDMEMVEINMDN